MATKGQDIVSVIKQQIESFGMPVTITDVGTVVEVGDGIARIHGLAGAKYNELIEFPDKIMGVALNLEEDSVSAIIMGDWQRLGDCCGHWTFFRARRRQRLLLSLANRRSNTRTCSSGVPGLVCTSIRSFGWSWMRGRFSP